MTGVAIPEREIQGREGLREAEDNAQVLLDFGDATFAVVTTGFTLQQYRTPALEVYGTTGTIQMLGMIGIPTDTNSGKTRPVGRSLARPTLTAVDRRPPAPRGMHPDRHRPTLHPEQALHVLEIILKAQESGRDGQTRTLSTTFPLHRLGPWEASAPPISNMIEPAITRTTLDDFPNPVTRSWLWWTLLAVACWGVWALLARWIGDALSPGQQQAISTPSRPGDAGLLPASGPAGKE